MHKSTQNSKWGKYFNLVVTCQKLLLSASEFSDIQLLNKTGLSPVSVTIQHDMMQGRKLASNTGDWKVGGSNTTFGKFLYKS